jgi:AraC family transcriptional regulator
MRSMANMEFRIEKISEKLLVGMNEKMSYIDDKTFKLWRNFMPNRNTIKNRVDNKYYSLQVYDEVFDYHNLNPAKIYTKWALVEVTSVENLAENMEVYRLKSGMYAVFIHIGPASSFAKSLKYIYQEWMPKSGYTVDNREHFEILEEGYDPTKEDAKEEIWIPICK